MSSTPVTPESIVKLRRDLRELLKAESVDQVTVGYEGFRLNWEYRRQGRPVEIASSGANEAKVRMLTRALIAAQTEEFNGDASGRGLLKWDLASDALEHAHTRVLRLEVPIALGDGWRDPQHQSRVDAAMGAIDQILGAAAPVDEASRALLQAHVGAGIERAATDREVFLTPYQRDLLIDVILVREVDLEPSLLGETLAAGCLGYTTARDERLVMQILRMGLFDDLSYAAKWRRDGSQRDDDQEIDERYDAMVSAMTTGRALEILESAKHTVFWEGYQASLESIAADVPRG